MWPGDLLMITEMWAYKELKRCCVALQDGVLPFPPMTLKYILCLYLLPFLPLLFLPFFLPSPNWPQADILNLTLKAFVRKSGYLWFCFVWGRKPYLLALLDVLCRWRTDYKNHWKSGQQKSCKQKDYLLMIINENQVLKCNDFSKIDLQNLTGLEGKCKQFWIFFSIWHGNHWGKSMWQTGGGNMSIGEKGNRNGLPLIGLRQLL